MTMIGQRLTRTLSRVVASYSWQDIRSQRYLRARALDQFAECPSHDSFRETRFSSEFQGLKFVPLSK